MQKLLSRTIIALVVCAIGLTGMAQAAQEKKEEMYPNKVNTHIGELTFDHGIPTEETSKKLYYELDYHRAVQLYLWSLPIVGQTQWRQSYLDLYDMKPNQMVYATQRRQEKPGRFLARFHWPKGSQRLGRQLDQVSARPRLVPILPFLWANRTLL